jgi:hypothetical protein
MFGYVKQNIFYGAGRIPFDAQQKSHDIIK